MLVTRRGIFSAGIGAVVSLPTLAAVEADQKPGHVVLLGDSILDNKRYVGTGPAVIDQLRAALPEGWKATLLAKDGSIAADIPKQAERLPADATHVVLSAGGNDALRAGSILTMKATSGAEVFGKLAEVRGAFQAAYARAVAAALQAGKQLVICTVYDPNYPDAQMQRMATTGLAVFNDAIGREAARRGVPVLDLRGLFTEKADYANPIEPSAAGGRKLVAAVRRIVTGHDFGQRRSVWYPVSDR
jgi:lysophospholipase L1-like esterase